MKRRAEAVHSLLNQRGRSARIEYHVGSDGFSRSAGGTPVFTSPPPNLPLAHRDIHVDVVADHKDLPPSSQAPSVAAKEASVRLSEHDCLRPLRVQGCTNGATSSDIPSGPSSESCPEHERSWRLQQAEARFRVRCPQVPGEMPPLRPRARSSVVRKTRNGGPRRTSAICRSGVSQPRATAAAGVVFRCLNPGWVSRQRARPELYWSQRGGDLRGPLATIRGLIDISIVEDAVHVKEDAA
jgi:hypothetical protein